MVIHEAFYKYHVDYNSGHDDCYVLQIFIGPSIIIFSE